MTQFNFKEQILKKGISEEMIKNISYAKKEPEWMTRRRLLAYEAYKKIKLPEWGPNLNKIDFNNFNYYVKATDKVRSSWDEIPAKIRKTYEKIGIPEAEKKFLSGVGAQYDSEMVYENILTKLSKKGVIFTDTDSALKKYEEMFKKYFGTIVKLGENKMSALNDAVWSGGSFIYIPSNVKVDLPLQAYFRINSKNLAQFERTFIFADKGSCVNYIEGCTAPVYSTDLLHAGVVEIFVRKGAMVRYTTIQNWSKNVYNLTTKRMTVEEEGVGEWIDGNLGSRVTMKYPSIYLTGKKARAEVLSFSFAGKNQHQDTGGKIIHLAEETTSLINSKSIAKSTGKNVFRGLIKIKKGARNCRAKMSCYSLLLDKESKTESYPVVDVGEKSSKVTHEAVVSTIESDQLFYLQNRGIPKKTAESLIINGFVEPIVKEIPLEYAVELNRLIQMEIE